MPGGRLAFMDRRAIHGRRFVLFLPLHRTSSRTARHTADVRVWLGWQWRSEAVRAPVRRLARPSDSNGYRSQWGAAATRHRGRRYAMAMALGPSPSASHSFSFDHRRLPETFRTAMAIAFFWPTINPRKRLTHVVPLKANCGGRRDDGSKFRRG
jgi:hypothetical protein